MATKKTSKNKSIPVGMTSLAQGTCELKRVDSAGEKLGEQTLMLVFRPESWGHSLVVDLGEEVPGFTADTPWEKILEKPVETRFAWLGKTYKASVRLERDCTAVVEVRESLSARSFRKTPFASYRVALDGAGEEKAETKQHVYAVSVASYYENEGELTSHCAAFRTPGEAADWFEEDWNYQADCYGGRKLSKKAKKAFLDALEDGKKDFVAEAESPADWGGCRFKWKGVRTEI